MVRRLKSKIHNVIVTQSELNYEGSCGIDVEMMEVCGILPYQEIEIYNITNGERFTTYAIPDEMMGMISIRGAGARKAQVGDRIIICAYELVSYPYDINYQPTKIIFDKSNNNNIFT